MAHADAVPFEDEEEAVFGFGPRSVLAVSRKCGVYDRKDACHAMPVRFPRQGAQLAHASHLADDVVELDAAADNAGDEFARIATDRADTKED